MMTSSNVAVVYRSPDVADLIAMAIREDLRDDGDITCRALVPQRARLDGVVRAKAAGVVCGLPLFQLVFDALAQDMPGCEVTVTHHVSDGTIVRPGDEVLRCSGNAVTMLIGERSALNLCQRLSGTATMARRYVEAVAGTKANVFDTRKTTPGMRLLEKHAVISGGARNHRMGLYDQVLIKDNHIALMPPGPLGSGPAEAVRRTRENIGEDILIEVEIERLDDLEPVIIAGADIVLLDNMAPEPCNVVIVFTSSVTGNVVLSLKQAAASPWLRFARLQKPALNEFPPARLRIRCTHWIYLCEPHQL
jgi:nicotinate-nucleotide pyrophosphorylase (carboxylating)